MKLSKYLLLIIPLLSATWGCNDEEFLNREPQDILLNDQVWEDEGLVLSVLADLYNRHPEFQQLEWWWEFTNFDEGFASNFGDHWRHQNTEYGYGAWGYWDYGYLRELNLFIQKAEAAEALDTEARKRFVAEGRFLRASVYFELVKRMGGVPLILEPLEYDFSGDPSYLQKPRAKEHEIYDFVISETEAIKADLPTDPAIKSRATAAAAAALQSRAALYAGSIAKYGQTTPQVSLPDGEVGISSAKADEYYTRALNAAEEIINGDLGAYALYRKSSDLGENFANLFLDKNGNSEVIFAKDYLENARTHWFTIENIPRSLREENTLGGKLNPTLNLVQQFELLDNTYAPLATEDGSGNYIYYDNPEDIFANRDARLWGTVIYPGASFRGKEVDIWAGYKLADNSVVTSGQLGGRAQLEPDGPSVQVVGFDGPISGSEWFARTGFYIRKYLDPDVGSGQRGTGSDVWWIRYRYGEVLLNAAEAAFELGQVDDALKYINEVRERAGFTTALTALSFDRIVHERKVELAFEGHVLWDMKRWRLAHKVWNGERITNPPAPGVADAPSTMIFGLWPYKVYDPGNPNDGKWVFEKVIPNVVTNPDRFRLGNYYSEIGNDIINNNPLIVRNPNQ